MSATVKLPETDRNVMDRFVNFEFWADGSTFWNGARKRAANRLVKRGFLARTDAPKTSGYLLTEAGKAYLSAAGRGSFRDTAQPTGQNKGDE